MIDLKSVKNLYNDDQLHEICYLHSKHNDADALTKVKKHLKPNTVL